MGQRSLKRNKKVYSTEWKFLKHLKEKKPTTSVILNGERLNAFPLRSERGQRCLFLLLLFNIVLQSLASEIKQEKEIKGILVREEEIKLFLFEDDMIIFVENLKKSILKNLLELISEFSKATEYKINIQKSNVILCTSNEHVYTEI